MRPVVQVRPLTWNLSKRCGASDPRRRHSGLARRTERRLRRPIEANKRVRRRRAGIACPIQKEDGGVRKRLTFSLPRAMLLAGDRHGQSSNESESVFGRRRDGCRKPRRDGSRPTRGGRRRAGAHAAADHTQLGTAILRRSGARGSSTTSWRAAIRSAGTIRPPYQRSRLSNGSARRE